MEHSRLVDHGGFPIPIAIQQLTSLQDRDMSSVHSGVMLIFAERVQSDMFL